MVKLCKENIHSLATNQEVEIVADVSEIIIRPTTTELICVPFMSGIEPFYINVIIPDKTNKLYRFVNKEYDHVTSAWIGKIKPIEGIRMECVYTGDYNRYVLRAITTRYHRTINNVQYCTGCGSMIFTSDENTPIQCCTVDDAIRTISKKPHLSLDTHRMIIDRRIDNSIKI